MAYGSEGHQRQGLHKPWLRCPKHWFRYVVNCRHSLYQLPYLLAPVCFSSSVKTEVMLFPLALNIQGTLSVRSKICTKLIHIQEIWYFLCDFFHRFSLFALTGSFNVRQIAPTSVPETLCARACSIRANRPCVRAWRIRLWCPCSRC